MVLDSEKKEILELLTNESLKLGCALDSSGAQFVLSNNGFHDIKKRFKVEKISDALQKIDGISVFKSKYPGGMTTIVIDSLSNMDDRYKTSLKVEKRLSDRLLISKKKSIVETEQVVELVVENDSRHSEESLSTPKNIQETKGKKQTQKDRTIQAINEFIHEHGLISTWQHALIAEKANSTKSSVSFCIAEMYALGELKREHIEDPDEQFIINGVLEEAIIKSGESVRFKPIKIALDEITGLDIDYIQLRIAMRDYHQNKVNNRFGWEL